MAVWCFLCCCPYSAVLSRFSSLLWFPPNTTKYSTIIPFSLIAYNMSTPSSYHPGNIQVPMHQIRFVLCCNNKSLNFSSTSFNIHPWSALFCLMGWSRHFQRRLSVVTFSISFNAFRATHFLQYHILSGSTPAHTFHMSIFYKCLFWSNVSPWKCF